MISLLSITLLLVIELYFTSLFVRQWPLIGSFVGIWIGYLFFSPFSKQYRAPLQLSFAAVCFISLFLWNSSPSWQQILWWLVLSFHWLSWVRLLDRVYHKNQAQRAKFSAVFQKVGFDISFYGTFIVIYLAYAFLHTTDSIGMLHHALFAFGLVTNYLCWENTRRVNDRNWQMLGMKSSQIAMYITMIVCIVMSALFLSTILQGPVSAFVPSTTSSIREHIHGQQDKNSGARGLHASGGFISTDSMIGYSADSLQLPSRLKLMNSSREDVFVEFEPSSLQRILQHDPIYLRGSTFTTVRGNQWVSLSDTLRKVEDADDENHDQKVTFDNRDPHPIRYRVFINNPKITNVLHIPNLAELNVNNVLATGNDTYHFDLGGSGRYSYRVASTMHHLSDIPSEKVVIGENLADSLVEIPQDKVYRKVKKLARSITKSHTHLIDQIDALKKFMHNHYIYSLEIRNRRNRNPLENFLFFEKRGHCVMFATSFCLFLRSLGIPSRLASGYCGGEYDSSRNLFTFYSANAHVWTEILLKDYGWVVIDPTPPYQIFSFFGGGVRLYDIDAIEDVNDVSSTLGWIEKLTQNVTYVFGFMSIFALLTLASIAISGRIKARQEKNANQNCCSLQSFSFYNQFCKKFETICPYRPCQTPREYLLQLKNEHIIDNEFDAMVDYVYAILYQEQARNSKEEKNFETLIKDFRSEQSKCFFSAQDVGA